LTRRFLTFDCYGTLIDWRTGIEAELRELLGDVRVRGQDLLKAYVAAEAEEETEYRSYREVLRRTALSLSGRLGATVSEDEATRFSGSVPKWPAFKDTGKFLRDMGSKGFQTYILSNVDDDILQETIRKNGLEVEGWVTAQEVRSYKPSPAHWVRFMQKTGARKGEMLHVAQSVYHDIVPCQGLDIASAWVNRYNEKMPSGPHPMFVTDDLAHLGELLDAELP
jgi:2-haloalkanoic acid dehalogenase type II